MLVGLDCPGSPWLAILRPMQNVRNAHHTSRWRVGHVRLFKLISEENSRLQRMERTPWMALGSGSRALSEMPGSSHKRKNFRLVLMERTPWLAHS